MTRCLDDCFLFAAADPDQATDWSSRSWPTACHTTSAWTPRGEAGLRHSGVMSASSESDAESAQWPVGVWVAQRCGQRLTAWRG
jgi:hypothetical protein